MILQYTAQSSPLAFDLKLLFLYNFNMQSLFSLINTGFFRTDHDPPRRPTP